MTIPAYGIKISNTEIRVIKDVTIPITINQRSNFKTPISLISPIIFLNAARNLLKWANLAVATQDNKENINETRIVIIKTIRKEVMKFEIESSNTSNVVCEKEKYAEANIPIINTKNGTNP